jgi:hypothetical protein
MSIRRLLTAVVVCTGMIVLSHSAAWAQGTPLFAVLLGGNEVSAGGDANAGDQNAFGSATVIFRGTDTLCWGILVTALDTPTFVSIIQGKAGGNGTSLVSIDPPRDAAGAITGNPGTSRGCITDPDPTWAALIRAIKTNPSLFYITVRSVAFPNGGLRGQLF